jgi:hypothetical protein
MSKEFQSWSAEAAISCHPIAVEQSSSMGISKRIYGPLRRTFLKLKLQHPTVPKELLLDMALKGYNDSAGINGLVPTVLVCGAFPKLPLKDADSNTHAPTHSERAQIRLTAMEYRKCIDKLRNKLTEKAQNPSIDTGLKRGDPVLCWSRRKNKWDGPQDFISETPHAFFVNSRKGEVRQMHKMCARKFVQGIRVSHFLPPPDYHPPYYSIASGPQDLRAEQSPGVIRAYSGSSVKTRSCKKLPAELLSLPNLTESSPVTPYDPPYGKTLQYFNPEDWLNTVGLVSDSAWALDVEESSHHAIDRSLEPPDTSHDKDVLFSLPFPRSKRQMEQLEREVLATEVLSPRDPRRAEFGDAIAAENAGLEKNLVFAKCRIAKNM